MQGVYNQRPPQPRYQSVWNVAVVLDFLKNLGSNSGLSRSQLSEKLVTLLALSRAPRISELHSLSTAAIRFLPDGVEFVLTSPTKTQRHGAPKVFFVPSLPQDPLLCPVACVRDYLAVTKPQRISGRTALFLATRQPYHPVCKSTLARWVKSVLQQAGVGECFGAHSTRGASATAAREGGVSLADVLATADWSQEHTFIRHYYRPQDSSLYTQTVLSRSLTSA